MQQLLLSILLISVLSGCGKVPNPPAVVECVHIAVEGIAPYMYCKMSDGSGEPFRVQAMAANKFMCTDPAGYVAGKEYVKELESWINANCKGGQ